MNCIAAVDSQQLTDNILKMGASDRIRKSALSDALKLVTRANNCKLTFSPDQALTIALGLNKASCILTDQNSKIMPQKLESLRRLSERFRCCFSRSINVYIQNIASFHDEKLKIIMQMEQDKALVRESHNDDISPLKRSIARSNALQQKRDTLLKKLCWMDDNVLNLLRKLGLTQHEVKTAFEHYSSPLEVQHKGFTNYSYEDYFSDEQALKKFGGSIVSNIKYGRRSFVEEKEKIFLPLTKKGEIWVAIRSRAEARRSMRNELQRCTYLHPEDIHVTMAQIVKKEVKLSKTLSDLNERSVSAIQNLRDKFESEKQALQSLSSARKVLPFGERETALEA